MNIEEELKKALHSVTDSRVKDAMAYSLLSGGKRIRPNLLFDTLEGYDIPQEKGIPFACALEMIHTYSLIHDDLPAMDNDDLRRGNPTCHKQFDEATAILAGDGLLTEAFVLASSAEADPKEVQGCIKILSKMAGASGMVYGQCLDMNEKEGMSFEDLKEVHHYKTGCLLSAPLMMGAVLAGHEEQVKNFEAIGTKIGLSFQIQDDILDVTTSEKDLGKSKSDERNHKITSVSLLGIEEANRMMNALYDEAIASIRQIPDFDAGALEKRIASIRIRQL